eukprot:963686_1
MNYSKHRQWVLYSRSHDAFVSEHSHNVLQETLASNSIHQRDSTIDSDQYIQFEMQRLLQMHQNDIDDCATEMDARAESVSPPNTMDSDHNSTTIDHIVESNELNEFINAGDNLISFMREHVFPPPTEPLHAMESTPQPPINSRNDSDTLEDDSALIVEDEWDHNTTSNQTVSNCRRNRCIISTWCTDRTHTKHRLHSNSGDIKQYLDTPSNWIASNDCNPPSATEAMSTLTSNHDPHRADEHTNNMEIDTEICNRSLILAYHRFMATNNNALTGGTTIAYDHDPTYHTVLFNAYRWVKYDNIAHNMTRNHSCHFARNSSETTLIHRTIPHPKIIRSHVTDEPRNFAHYPLKRPLTHTECHHPKKITQYTMWACSLTILLIIIIPLRPSFAIPRTHFYLILRAILRVLIFNFCLSFIFVCVHSFGHVLCPACVMTHLTNIRITNLKQKKRIKEYGTWLHHIHSAITKYVYVCPVVIECTLIGSQQCIRSNVQCKDCKQMINKTHLTDHRRLMCPERSVECTLCGKVKRKSMTYHWRNNCKQYLIHCFLCPQYFTLKDTRHKTQDIRWIWIRNRANMKWFLCTIHRPRSLPISIRSIHCTITNCKQCQCRAIGPVVIKKYQHKLIPNQCDACDKWRLPVPSNANENAPKTTRLSLMKKQRGQRVLIHPYPKNIKLKHVEEK